MRHLIDTLEARSFFSVTSMQVTPTSDISIDNFSAPPAAVTAAVSKAAAKASAKAAAVTNDDDEYNMTSAQVAQLMAQAGAAMKDGQAVAIVDREGVVLGVYATPQASQETVKKAVERARTGAYFASTGEAFSTRTARFIIQNHFPTPIRNTPGGPLYGVEFSSLPGADIVPEDLVKGEEYGYVSGDPGGLPLYFDKIPAGGIGVAGDNKDTAPIGSLQFPGQKIYNGKEESDFDEAVALAAVKGLAAPKAIRINAEAPASIRATKVILGNTGLRFPYTASSPAKTRAFLTLAQLVSSGRGRIEVAPADSQPNPYPKVDASVYGVAGELKNTTVAGYGIVASNDVDPDTGQLYTDDEKLTTDDVNTIIRQAVQEAMKIRAGIRLPTGKNAVVHVAVVDRDGTVLGVFRMNDGTNFSFDVAVQKARTAAFFSDDTHAFSTRAIGFMSQKFYPSGIDGGGTGPLYLLQDAISDDPDLGSGPLANGITVFPGGIPLYKNGVMVGAIGISGDGVEEDDQISFAGATGFQAPAAIRSDALSQTSIRDFIVSRVQAIVAMKDTSIDFVDRPITTDFVANAFKRLTENDVDLPYVKFKRNPYL